VIRTGPFRTEAGLILASASPRRRVLLQDLGLDFKVIVVRIDERPKEGETPCDFVVRAAGDKAAAVSRENRSSWVLGADTVVVLGSRILGKPKDPEEAINVLLDLSGRQHHVHTGFSLRNDREQVSVSRVVTTEVKFFHFSREIAAAYVATGDPLDKAGAYGIQGRGGFLVERINGSYSNVVGLPLYEVVQELLDHKVVVSR
jgi:nucleoside triphosphate pyrophosphatase